MTAPQPTPAADLAAPDRPEEPMTEPEQPYGPGAMCDTCGHFAARHDEVGCHFDRKPPQTDCGCAVMRWLGVEWPRPWLPAPAGLSK